MPTRLKRPNIWRQLLVTAALVAFQSYLGYSVVTGQFGIEGQDVMEKDMEELSAKSGALAAEIESFRHRVDLFRSSRLDPDILTERARALLAMSSPDDIVVMTDPNNGKLISSSYGALPEDQLNAVIEKGID